MEVTVTFAGVLRQQAGVDELTFELLPGARFGDLLDAIGERLGERLGERYWDEAAREFRPGVTVVGEGRGLDSRDTPIKEGESIRVMPVVGGG